MRGNWFAVLVLIAWVPVVATIFQTNSRSRSIILCLGLGSLFLPSSTINLPALPALDRMSIPIVTTFLAVCMTNPRSLSLRQLPMAIKLIGIVLMLGTVLAVPQNTSAIHVEGTVMSGLTYYEGVSFSFRLALTSLIPFLLGYAAIRRPRDVKIVLIVVMILGVIYSLFILFEIQMSPRLHKILYGFRQHSFGQTMRFGGWRPMVFMSHGLEVALFMTTTVVAAIALARTNTVVAGIPVKAVAIYLVVVTVFCKSMASWFYLLFSVPVLGFFSSKRQLQAAALVGCLLATYPALRMSNVFPTESLASYMEGISEARGQSLRFRFRNEELLLEHTKERMLSGWGRFRRSQVYDEQTGKLASVPDGYWLVAVSTRGVIGLVASFALLLYPLFRAWRRFPQIRSTEERAYLAGLCWIVAIIGLDMLPNAMINAMTYFFPGALLAAVAKPTRIPRTRPATPRGEPGTLAEFAR